ncbi:MAG: TRAP transporter small permease [Candidatus Goldbacteria bacterium]|nr:TRAP transporter small permease [Candidatus Goldiibacteriota bacterium]
MDFLRRLNCRLYKFQKIFIVVVFLLLLFLSLTQVLLRLFLNLGLESADSIIRYLVMWVGFLGASLATYKNRHINIDVASQFFKKLNKNAVNLIVNSFSFIICFLFLIASIIFILNEINEAARIVFIPVWVLELILPLVFLFMLFSFLQKILETILYNNKRKK